MPSTFILVQPNVQKPQVITAGVWKLHKDLLRELCLVQDLPLYRVIQIMATEHNFHVSERALNYRIKKWQWTKYVPKKIMRTACRKSHKDSRRRDFRYEGRLVDLARFESRHEDFDPATSPTASTPSALVWESASPSAVSNMASNASTPRPEWTAVPSLDSDANPSTPITAAPAKPPVPSLSTATDTPPEDELDEFWLNLDLNTDEFELENSAQVELDPTAAEILLALDNANDTSLDEPFEAPLDGPALNPNIINPPLPNPPPSLAVPWKSGRTLASHYVSAKPFTTDNIDLFSRPIPLDIDGYTPERLQAHPLMHVAYSLPFRPTRDSRTDSLWICCRCHFMNNRVLCGGCCVECAHVGCMYCHSGEPSRADLKRRACARHGAVCTSH